MAIHGEESFSKVLHEIDQAISFCVDNRFFSATLLLIYSVMDAFSYIECPDENNQKVRFENWINKWVLPHEKVLCDAVDLYAARSGILHRLGTRSRLSESGQASHISYCHGSAPFEGLEMMRKELYEKHGKYLPIVKLEALVEAVRKGVRNFLEFAESDVEMKKKMEDYFSSEQAFRFSYDD